MNERQKLFCLSMLKDKTQTQAAIDAGYAKGCADRTGSRLMRNVEIKTYLARHQRIVTEKALEIASFDVADILAALWDNHIRANLLDRPDFSASNRSLELLGKNKRMFADVSEVVFTDGIKKLLNDVISVIDDKVDDRSLRDEIIDGLAAIGRK